MNQSSHINRGASIRQQNTYWTDQCQTSLTWKVALSLKGRALSPPAIADLEQPTIFLNWAAADPHSHHEHPHSPVLLVQLQHSGSFQPIGFREASLIYIQVKDSTDGVKDPVAMVMEPGQDSYSLAVLELYLSDAVSMGSKN